MILKAIKIKILIMSIQHPIPIILIKQKQYLIHMIPIVTLKMLIVNPQNLLKNKIKKTPIIMLFNMIIQSTKRTHNQPVPVIKILQILHQQKIQNLTPFKKLPAKPIVNNRRQVRHQMIRKKIVNPQKNNRPLQKIANNKITLKNLIKVQRVICKINHSRSKNKKKKILMILRIPKSQNYD